MNLQRFNPLMSKVYTTFNSDGQALRALNKNELVLLLSDGGSSSVLDVLSVRLFLVCH